MMEKEAANLLPTLENWLSSGSFFSFKSHQIFFKDSGESTHQEGEQKPALMLIHGFPTASWDWCKIWNTLSEHFRVITLDMIGFGFSNKPESLDYTIHTQADIFEALLKHLNINECHLVAHDYGDSVAQELLYRHAHIERNKRRITIHSATLLNGGLFPESHKPKFIQVLLNSFVGSLVAKLVTKKSVDKNMRSIFGKHTQPTKQELEIMWALITHNNGKRVFHKLISYMTQRKHNRERWLHALTHAVCPIQLVNGCADPISGGHMVARFEELVSSKHIVKLHDIGHYPQIEAPKEIAQAIISFINNN